MRMLPLAAATLATLSLGGCNLSSAFQTGVQACHTATLDEANSPSLVAHNGKIVAGVTQLCADVSALSAVNPPAAQ